MKENKKKLSQAMLFIILFGIVSLFSDMTHEGASSIRGAYLSLLGASAATIGFVSGLGELIGYSMRYVFGKLTDKTKHYWPMTILGYILDVLAVPALALVGEHGWIAACALLVIQRLGKAIKKPAKDTIMSFAASQEGVGKSFGIQEVLDQIGAFLGPVLLYLVMLFKTDSTTFEVYSTCFAVLAIPGVVTLILLIITRYKFPNPEHFEPEPKEYIPFRMKKEFVLYIAGISLFAFGFIDNHARFAYLRPPEQRPCGDRLTRHDRHSAAAVCGGNAGRCSGGACVRTDVRQARRARAGVVNAHIRAICGVRVHV